MNAWATAAFFLDDLLFLQVAANLRELFLHAAR
jgi:hypothetical protein